MLISIRMCDLMPVAIFLERSVYRQVQTLYK